MPVIEIIFTFSFLSGSRILFISSVLPEKDKAKTISCAVIIPKSPCRASVGWTKNEGVPVEAKVAAILRPICPLLPMPISTKRPLQAAMVLTAFTKSSLKHFSVVFKACCSVLKTSFAMEIISVSEYFFI